jgi:hypothetical protein
VRDVHVLPFEDPLGGWGNSTALGDIHSSLATTGQQLGALDAIVRATAGTFSNATASVWPLPRTRAICRGLTHLADVPSGHRDRQQIGTAEDDDVGTPPDDTDTVDQDAETLPETPSDKEGEAKGPQSGGLSTLDGGM